MWRELHERLPDGGPAKNSLQDEAASLHSCDRRLRQQAKHVSRHAYMYMDDQDFFEAGMIMEIGWMTEALADMETFAKLNGMTELREQLAVCRDVAGAVEAEQKAARSSPTSTG